MESIPKIERRTKEIKISPEELAKLIDHTKLTPYKSMGSMKRLCEEAKAYHFYSVCINPYWTRFCTNELKGTDIIVDTVVGFPLGQTTTKEKVLETKEAIEEGASEIDMVMNVAAFKDKNFDFVREDIKAVAEATGGNPVKVILETGYLTYEEITIACKLVKEAGADFVKNSTGLGPFGATIPHVVLMRRAVGKNFGVKAAGDINEFRDALRMIVAGANRIGSSSGVRIIDSYRWAKHSDWLIEEIPCRLCPSRKATFKSMPKLVFQYYKLKCVDCPYRRYNRFYE
jgi:deoxyribose-phosphate aldolase